MFNIFSFLESQKIIFLLKKYYKELITHKASNFSSYLILQQHRTHNPNRSQVVWNKLVKGKKNQESL